MPDNLYKLKITLENCHREVSRTIIVPTTSVWMGFTL